MHRKTLAAVIIVFLVLSLIGVGAAYIYIFRKGTIVIRVVDQNDKPLEGAIVQLSALAPPSMPNASIQILTEKTDKRGTVIINYRDFKNIVDKWCEDLKSMDKLADLPRTFKVAVFISVIYETEKGIYLEDGYTVTYSPALMKNGHQYVKTIKINLTEEPTIAKTELEELEETNKTSLKASSFTPKDLAPHYEWRKVKELVYPASGYDKIPIIWCDARNHPSIRGTMSIYMYGAVKATVGVNLGFCYAKNLNKYSSGGATFKFKLGDFVVASSQVEFGDTGYIDPGKFSYIYVWGQIACEEWRLYYVWGYGSGTPLDQWKYYTYFKSLKVQNGKIIGSHESADKPPLLLTKLYEYVSNAGFRYDFYKSYTGKGGRGDAYKVYLSDIKSAYIKNSGVPYEVGVSLGAAFAALIAEAICPELALPTSILSVIAGSYNVEGTAYFCAWVQFDADAGNLMYLYVGVTDFQYEYKTWWMWRPYKYYLPVFGLKF